MHHHNCSLKLCNDMSKVEVIAMDPERKCGVHCLNSVHLYNEPIISVSVQRHEQGGSLCHGP
jgi:hypothetical protein